ncbi:MAG: aldehyde dehydrogenase family protein [Melioribacteraceae bacterium]|nr:aldehyde dehydrogenase family protein [Melioribacteraceae bacterium]MCF8356494.1 aldehyde dehydrogenase family protein [Melioribacteraceae bacterium]MCF8394853.1 aldehyde dehydrogenase family protein [Melioribacteraceae bacterium]MCF8420581.1 aldehyde dehydrogenase family protein [Melioribacteraceae bacterium]
MNFDKDLQSIQEARTLAAKAKEAQLEFKHYNQNQVDKIVKAMADAGYAQSERLAKLAHEETGFGNWQDKVIKNQFGTRDVYVSIKDLKSVGVIDVQQNGKIVKIAEPMGVVAALVPSTNPTSTAMFKAIISIKCRNAIVASPHPKAVNCTSESLQVLSDAAEKAGAPKGLMQCLTNPTIEGTEALMRDKNVAVILATGSTPMVRAAYSAGKPAYGVGSGNVPAFIERTADYKKAVADIVTGTTFDNGTLCSSEQALIVDRPIKDKVKEEAKSIGCYFVEGEEKSKLENAVTKGGRINPDIVGKPAAWIAEYAGFSVPEKTKVLIAECENVGKDEPLSMEKLSPILAFYVVDGWLEGCHKCIDLLNFGGIGHTMAIHSNDKDIILKFALEKPAFRIVANTPSSLGAVGYSTALYPSMTLGPGTWGGSIVSENVTAHHLMNVKTLAFETRVMNKGNSINIFEDSSIKRNSFSPANSSSSFTNTIEERLRARAGNPVVNPFNKKIDTKDNPEVKKSTLGTGISESEIQKIISEFNKR